MMIMFLGGMCDICGSTDALATPEQCKAAGLDLDAAICVECLKRANPAGDKTPEPEPRKPS